MRYLGLDLGTTSLGVAISDKTNTLVSPLTLIKFKKEDYNEIINIKESLFIRKFNYKNDAEIVNKLFDWLRKKG